MYIADYERVTGPVVDTKFEEIPRLHRLIADKSGKIYRPFINGLGRYLPRGRYDMVNNFYPPYGWKEGFPHFYLFQAFKRVVQLAKNDGVKNLLWIEDDLVFTDDFDEILPKALADLPSDWELFSFGSNHFYHETEEVGPNLLKINGSYCTHCFGIRDTVFQTVLDMPDIDGIDTSIGKYIHSRGKSYAVWPSIALQKPGFSTLLNSPADYTDFFKSKGKNW